MSKANRPPIPAGREVLSDDERLLRMQKIIVFLGIRLGGATNAAIARILEMTRRDELDHAVTGAERCYSRDEFEQWVLDGPAH